jgi:hypothetical protein
MPELPDADYLIHRRKPGLTCGICKATIEKKTIKENPAISAIGIRNNHC